MYIIDGRDVSHLKLLAADRDLILKIYETLWRAIERENNLINQRMTWPITLSSGFILAESFLVRPIFDQFAAGKITIASPALCLIALAMSAIAAEFSWRSKRSVDAAIDQLTYLRTYYESCKTAGSKNLFEEELYLPRPHGDPAAHTSGTEAAKKFPQVLFTSWCALLVIEAIAFIFLVKISM